MYDALIRRRSLAEIVVPTIHPGSDLAPSAPALAGAEVEMVSMLAREYLLRRTLETIAGAYDHVLIDCPPSLGLLTINALTSADRRRHRADPVRVSGAGRAGPTVANDPVGPGEPEPAALHQRHGADDVRPAHQPRRSRSSTRCARHFPEQTFRTVIPRSVRLSEAPSYGQTILAYAPHSAGALAYQALAQELLEREAQLEAGS